ncbi:PREDICTED: uncharacterized protein LOC101304505 [Fragaria vesca subsp. vesca]|uniref:uncharacterized protein LOC101304505 n=1 Tax=Fragaria vesca subsp. vesca TaxID=101020 RepID=UPI0002C36DC5|nr:PREDICTED: uncharacterized protein LOC101304505 [Fragaria vesca subsp. vesca]
MDSSQSSIPTSGVFKSLSDSPPSHCSLNIESFSLLSEFLDGNSSDPEDAYESEEFKAGGYKWKLVIYPKGNKKKKVEDHISVYLQIAGANSLEMGWEVYVDFRLFLLDQSKNVYMVFEDAFTRKNCIHGAKLDVGFDKLVPLDEFHDASHGYLVDDKCVFGAEVFVCKETRRGMGECISRVKSPKTYKYIWKLRNFSSLTDPYYPSEPFTVEDQKWIIQLYPKGVDQQNRHIGIYLQLVDRKATPPATKVFAELSIPIVHPLCSGLYWSRTDPGYGIHGQGQEALKVFDDMPFMFGCRRFGDIQYDVASIPTEAQTRALWNIGCLLGRTGELDKAMEIVERMPNPAEPHVWGALLGACRIHNNVKLGEVVAKRLLELEPDDAGISVHERSQFDRRGYNPDCLAIAFPNCTGNTGNL